jgi:F-type H+-transporting ATPase subunit b
MGLDLFTVAAQIINFLILVWLLKKFLYRPVLDAMQRREKRIAGRLEEAVIREQQAEAEKTRLQKMQEDLRSATESQMRAARNEADAFRNDLEKRAKEEVTANRNQWLADLEKEKHNFLEQASKDFCRHFSLLARNAFRELSDYSLNERTVAVFLHKLEEMDLQNHQEFKNLLGTGDEQLLLKSAFPLTESAKKQICVTLNRLAGRTVEVEFQHEDSLLIGIILEGAGKKISWNMAHYLETFAKKLSASLDHERIR